MELILWRHADAEAPGLRPDAPDLQRELTALGRRQAAHVADWLNVRLPEQCRILCSPAVRAQQTVDLLERDYHVSAAIGPGAEPRALLAVAGWPDRHGAVLVVAHQPTLGRTASLVLCGREQEWAIPRGALWWFELVSLEQQYGLCLKAVVTPALTLK
jgi:phosphohistidine phosphatase